MYGATSEQRTIDAEHLRLLRIGYFISAGMSGFYSLMGLFYIGIGAFFGAIIHSIPQKPGMQGPPEFMGWMIGGIGAAFSLFFIGMALLKLRVARCLRERKSHTYCVAIGVIACLDIPYGTALGVFTFLALTRPSVKELFGIAS